MDIHLEEHHHTQEVVVVVVGSHRTIEEGNPVLVAEVDILRQVVVIDSLMIKVLVVACRKLVLAFVVQGTVATIDTLVVRSQLVKVFHLKMSRLEQNFIGLVVVMVNLLGAIQISNEPYPPACLNIKSRTNHQYLKKYKTHSI